MLQCKEMRDSVRERERGGQRTTDVAFISGSRYCKTKNVDVHVPSASTYFGRRQKTGTTRDKTAASLERSNVCHPLINIHLGAADTVSGA